MNFDEINTKLNVLAKAGMKNAFQVRDEVISRVGKNKSAYKKNQQNYRGISANGTQLSLFN